MQEPRALLGSVKQGALLLADLGYFCFQWFDELTELGYSWISRVKENTSVVVVHTYYEERDQFRQTDEPSDRGPSSARPTRRDPHATGGPAQSRHPASQQGGADCSVKGHAHQTQSRSAERAQSHGHDVEKASRPT